MAATIGSSASSQRAYSFPPEKGVTITAPVSGWGPTGSCVIDPTAGGQYRCINSGNVYQVITGGTTAASGGPQGTGSNITDGTVHWKFLGENPGQAVTTGSQIVAYVARGTQSTLPSGSAGIPPYDTLGGAFTTMGNFTYNGFSDSFCGVFYRSTPVTTTSSYQLIAQFGGTSNGSGAGDELTLGYMEIRNVPFGAPHTSSHTEVANSTSTGICQAATITTTKPCIIVSIWAGNGNVLSAGQSHTAIPLNGLTLVSGCNDLVALGASGYIQVAIATRLATASLVPFAEQWRTANGTTGEGAQLFTLAFEDTTLTGSALITEAADALSADGVITNVGSGTITLGADTVSSAGNVILIGSGSLTESSDTVSGTATSTLFGSGSVADDSDVVLSVGNVILIGSGSVTEDSDVTSASGSPIVLGSGSITDDAESVSSAGNVLLIGSGSIADASDTASGSGSPVVIGSGSLTFADDSLSSSGNVILIGSGSVTEESDSSVGTGLFNAIVGSADLTEESDAASGAGNPIVVGSGAISLAADSLSSIGVITLLGSGAITDADDTAAGASSQLLTGSGSPSDGDDSASGFGFGPLFGSGSILLQDDTVSSSPPEAPPSFRVLSLTPQSELPRGPGVPFGGGGRRIPFRIK